MKNTVLISSAIVPGLLVALALHTPSPVTESHTTNEPIRLRSAASFDGDIVALTSLHSPTLSSLGATKPVVTPHELVGRSRFVGGSVDLQDGLAGVYALAIDMQELGARELDVFERTVLQSAKELDVPIVIENPDAKRMSKLFGFGVDAPVVLQRGPDLYPLGGGEFAGVPVAPLSRSEIAERIDEILVTEPAERARSGGSGQLPDYAYQVRYVHIDESNAYVAEYVPNSVMVPPPADFDIVFEVEWWYENNHKYCAINTKGAGFDPIYVHQSPTHKGYFQDRMFVQYGPADDPGVNWNAIELLDYSPRNVEQHRVVGSTKSTTRGFSGGIGASRSGPTATLGFSRSSTTSTSTSYEDSDLTHFRQTFGPDDDSVQFVDAMNKSYRGGLSEFKVYRKWEDLLSNGLGFPAGPVVGSPGHFLVSALGTDLNTPASVSSAEYNIYSAASWIADGARTDSQRFNLAAGQRILDINAFPHSGWVVHVLVNGAMVANNTDVWIDWGRVSGDAATSYLGYYGLAIAPATTQQIVLEIHDVSGAQMLGNLWIAGQPFPITGTHVPEPLSDRGHALIKVYADAGLTFPLASLYLKPELVSSGGTTPKLGYESKVGVHVGFDPGLTKEDLYNTGLELNVTEMRIP